MIVTHGQIRNAIMDVKNDYPLKRVVLFGSRAEGTEHRDSDVDLIMEFFAQVSLIALSEIQCRLRDILGVNVDIPHGPIRETDMIEIGREIELYAA